MSSIQHLFIIFPENVSLYKIQLKALIKFKFMLYFASYFFSFTQKFKKSTIQIDQSVEIQRSRFFVCYFQLVLAALLVIVKLLEFTVA